MEKVQQADLEALSLKLSSALKQKHWLLATAESCTGGWLAQVITAIAGSSDWFERGFVTYSNAAKQEMLGVSAELIEKYGAVSEPVARAMAEGALSHSRAQVSIAITGIAGPTGGTPEKPIGTVCLAWSGKDFATISDRQHFNGDRTLIRALAVKHSLLKILNILGK